MNIAIMLSGGIGSRIGGEIPKQYLKINEKRIIYYSLDAIINSKYIDKICIVANREWQSNLDKELSLDAKEKLLGYAEPGENRQLSILSGLRFIKEALPAVGDEDIVLIHDAARPYLTEDMIKNYIEALAGHDGVIPVLPMKDTVYVSEDGKTISALVERKTIFAGQAPEVFKFNKYLEANERLIPEKILSINGSTEPAIMACMDIVMVAGEEKNIKITTKEDIEKITGVSNDSNGCI